MQIEFRPFAEAQVGVERFVRIGGDISFGRFATGGVQLRDVVAGNLSMPTGVEAVRGTRFVVGADIARVRESAYLPASSGYTLTASRPRVRVGFTTTGKKSALFYGLTWLGKEFVNQPSNQVVGSLSIRLKL